MLPSFFICLVLFFLQLAYIIISWYLGNLVMIIKGSYQNFSSGHIEVLLQSPVYLKEMLLVAKVPTVHGYLPI